MVSEPSQSINRKKKKEKKKKYTTFFGIFIIIILCEDSLTARPSRGSSSWYLVR